MKQDTLYYVTVNLDAYAREWEGHFLFAPDSSDVFEAVELDIKECIADEEGLDEEDSEYAHNVTERLHGVLELLPHITHDFTEERGCQSVAVGGTRIGCIEVQKMKVMVRN